MEQRICYTAGFYAGAGVTPAPTPVPTTDQATYRNVTWNGATIKALCDVYGRLYVNQQLISGDNYFAGIAWDDNGIVSGFDSDDEAFMQIILTYGCNDAVTSYNETSATVTINDESVVFNFTNGQLVPVTSAWQQGSTPMFFYRTVNDGSSDVTVVCDPEGKLYVSDNDYYILRVNDGFAWSTGAASQTLITNCGGKVAMDVAAGDDNLMTVISMDDYTVVFNEDGVVTVGRIEELSLKERNITEGAAILVDQLGKVVYFSDNGAAYYYFKKEMGNWSRYEGHQTEYDETFGVHDQDISSSSDMSGMNWTYFGIQYNFANSRITPTVPAYDE